MPIRCGKEHQLLVLTVMMTEADDFQDIVRQTPCLMHLALRFTCVSVSGRNPVECRWQRLMRNTPEASRHAWLWCIVMQLQALRDHPEAH